MRVFIAAIGSGGDLIPMLGIGVELQRRGHQVTLLAGSQQERSVRALGLDFHAVLTGADFDRFVARAKVVNAAGAAWVVFFHDMVMPAMVNVQEYVSGRIVPGDTLLIGSSHAIGLRLIEEKYGVPLVTTRLQPQSIDADEATDEQVDTFNRLFEPPLNRYRRRLGLAPITEPFDRWMIALERAVAFFPPWFPDPRVDAPRQGHMVDFIFFDPAGNAPSTREMDVFLAGHEPPIVFTHGTGNDSVAEFFAVAEQACAQLGKPGIFLTRHRDKLSATLPPDILHVDYFPLERLLPVADAIVYHGGIGTCAQALKAGIPHLVVPVGFDQHQNAERIECLGVGARLRRQDFTVDNVTRHLAHLLDAATVQKRCRELSGHFTRDDGIGRCCDKIESLARPH